MIESIRYSPTADLKWVLKFAHDHFLKTETEDPLGQNFPREVHELAARRGLFRLPLPVEYGGQSLSVTDLAWTIRHLSTTSPSAAATFIGNLLGLSAILLYAADPLRTQVLSSLKPDELELWSFAMTEAGAGSDLLNIKTTVRGTVSGFVLNGEKNFITNASFSKNMVVFAREFSADGKDLGISCFYVPGDTKNLRRGDVMNKTAWRKANTGTLHFADCPLSGDARLGEPGQGLRILTHCLNRSKTLLGAMGVGISDRALDLSCERLDATERFQKTLLEQPVLRHRFAQHYVEKEAAWLMVLKAASTWDAGFDATTESSMAKLFSGKTALGIASAAIEYFGARGLFNDFEVSRLWADAKAVEIVEGPSLVQELLIGRGVLPSRKAKPSNFVLQKDDLKKAG